MSTQLDKETALAGSMLGSELDAADCALLADQMGLRQMQAGDVLVRESERRRTLFVLAAGHISVCREDDARDTILYQLRIGECAGTRAFLDGSERMATLRADTDGAVLTLEPEDFETLIDSHPRIVYKVMRALCRVTHANLMRMNLESAELRNYLMKTGGRY
ncbi:MAG TPA: cyclic nucleotide-binding domain-containing protein [Gammaproteobacteria bacterium]|nr:cyclic nucleotide-binding domain-containing protein [Gammaproteobacteria bacterium]